MLDNKDQAHHTGEKDLGEDTDWMRNTQSNWPHEEVDKLIEMNKKLSRKLFLTNCLLAVAITIIVIISLSKL
ncbi:hypothetical protein EV207_13140 [Scopulibacillus darangshiensis]|uniref:Uncharacterized protein n=1 Tax=Scopulibacillus darangshiensis TaxID=442528 RepID=A0A4R2NQ30_9BACL|nr:hypothetical protein [Scopulibacillus darangshiensis]TCP23478.1 hypothetical protein EV207_13140 [Scopulibacillus darangshiensis]